MVNIYKVKRRLSGFAIAFILSLISIIGIGPVYYMIVTSFKSKSEYLNNIFGLPENFIIDNYMQVVFEYNFPKLFLNSMIITFLSIIIGVYLAALASFAFGKMEFKGKNIMLNAIIPLMAVPAIVMIIPLFVIMNRLGLVNQYPAPIIIYIGLIIPISIYLLTSFMNSIPNELIEAAKIDGCNYFSIFHRIVIPLSIPAIATVVIVNGIWVWNELLIAFIFLQDESKRTIIVGLTSLQGLFNVNIPLMMAGATIVTIPMIVIYILFSRRFVRGLVQGSIK